MLTPSFDIEQNDEFVILTIRVPYIKISEAEFYINGTEFKFYCKPYFLRLHLPGELVDDDRQKASYDVDSGTIVAQLPKLHRGQHFENLGMITSLLSKKPAKDLRNIGASPGIEVAPGSSDAGIEVGGGDGEGESGEESDEFDWQVEQQLPEDQDSVTLLGTAARNCYGFADLHSGVFSKLQEEIPSIVDCPDPDHMTSHERRVGRIAHEEASFDPEHYLADLMDNDAIEGLLSYEPPWRGQLVKWREKRKTLLSSVASAAAPSEVEPGQGIVTFTAEERDQLKELPNRDFLLDKAMKRTLYLGLVDIIFAFAYDHRTTLGESNVESAWTICKLSSTLSWLEVFRGSVYEVIYCCLRRSLTYPLFRHWQLALTVLQDVRDIFRLGRRKVLQCLLAVRQLLNSSEPYYILNNLYITEYCVWIQKASARKIQNIADELDEVKVVKSAIGWDLQELEEAAHLVLDEESQRHEEIAATSSENDAAVEQLTSNIENIQLSSSVTTGDSNAGKTDLSTKTATETGVCTLLGHHQTQTKEEMDLAAIKLSSSIPPAPSDTNKPLIEELDRQQQQQQQQQLTENSSSNSSSNDSSSESGSSSSEEDNASTETKENS